MNTFERVYALFGNESALVAFANSQGGEAIPAGDIRVSQKAAGLFGAYGAAYLHVLTQHGAVTEERFLATLTRFADGDIPESVGKVADFAAHLTWLSGQPFRGSDRIPRIANFVFPQLPAEEIAKDRDQIVRSARFIVDELQQTQTSAAA